MELIGVIFIYMICPLESFLRIGDVGTISKFLGALVFALFILRILKNNRISIPREGYFFLAFIAFGLASSFWAIYPNTSVTRVITLIQLFILYLITYNIFRNNETRLARNAYNIIILFGFGISLYVVFQVIETGSISQWTRISISKDVDVNHLASFLIPSFLFGMHYAFSKSRKYVIPTLFILAAIILTQSRGAVVAVVISVGIYFFIHLKRKEIKIHYILIAALVTAVFVKIIPSEFLYRITLMFTDPVVLMDGSGRHVIWGWAWLEFVSSPIWGIGLGNFTELYRPPHSSLFQVISELGLLGLGMIGLFVVSSLGYKGFWQGKTLQIEWLAVVALLIMSLTVDIFYQKYLWILIGIWSAKRASYKCRTRVQGVFTGFIKANSSL